MGSRRNTHPSWLRTISYIAITRNVYRIVPGVLKHTRFITHLLDIFRYMHIYSKTLYHHQPSRRRLDRSMCKPFVASVNRRADYVHGVRFVSLSLYYFYEVCFGSRASLLVYPHTHMRCISFCIGAGWCEWPSLTIKYRPFLMVRICRDDFIACKCGGV